VPLIETIGRAQEIAAVADMLRGSARLLTLTGPGGIGKSRLALEVARKERDAYPGGVHFVPLAPVTDPELVLYAIADRLGVPVEGTRGALHAIVDHIADQRALILLDNLEQVAAVGRELSSLLERCPDLRILATSRQTLRVRGERAVSLAPLPLPDPDLPLSLLEEQPAVQLFVERAQSVSASFTLSHDNRAAVVELCRRLDGLPLAIELAAARTRLLSPRALLHRLNERFDALGAGGADLPERQRTMRATMDWSHERIGLELHCPVLHP
jgi:predicted ATPase